EGNLWVRATLPVDISFEASSKLADEIRQALRGFRVVTHVISQLGRPDDGTDVTTFNNIEFFVQLKPEMEWPGGLTKTKLIRELAVLQETGQPELLVSIDREAGARYGLAAADVDVAVQAAVGGQAATQVLQPFGAIGGVLALLVTGTPFSISAAVGFTSALGVGTLGGCVFLSGIRRVERVTPHALSEAVQQGALLELRPILMAC